jgi:hypothetical protein
MPIQQLFIGKSIDRLLSPPSGTLLAPGTHNPSNSANFEKECTMLRKLSRVNFGKRLFIITQALALMTAIWLVGCLNPIVDDTNDDREDDVGKILMHQTGGFAGVSLITSIGEKDGKVILTRIDAQADKSEEIAVSEEDVARLWETLEENDVYSLSSNQELLENVRDAFFIELTVERGGKYNQFSVYAAELLADTGEVRYGKIVQAIQQFADSHFKADEEFIIADMPVTDISVQILESFPYQIHIVVKGYLGDACTELNEITQRREDNTVYVHITTKRPRDAICAQVIKDVTERVPLEGGFLPGSYKVVVNGVEKEFELQGEVDMNEAEGIMRGKVTIGPLCPVEPCDLPPEQIARIYEARKVFVYEKATEVKITEANLRGNGEFSFSLRSGIYIVDISDAEGNELPLDSLMRSIGNALPQEVEVKPYEEVTVNFDIDTGIRSVDNAPGF